MNQTTPVDARPHPGEILHVDRIEEKSWTVKVSDVPEGIAWVEVSGRREPVVRIEITGTREQRRITKFGLDGQVLETTIQAPRTPPPVSR